MAVAKKESFDTWFGTAAEKATFASMARGDKYVVTDGAGGLFTYTGAAWIADPAGSVISTSAVADGANVTLGAKADAAATVGDATPFSVIALLKGIFNKIVAMTTALGGRKYTYTSASTSPPADGAAAGLTWKVTDTGDVKVSNGATWVDDIDVSAADPVHLAPVRTSAVLHRNAIKVVDKIADFGADSVALADNGAGTGSLKASTAHYCTAIPCNRWGPTKVSTTIETISTAAYGANTGSVRATIAQATGAEYYEIMFSEDAAPKWVARITEAQRVAGCEISALGTVGAGGAAGAVDIDVIGTGVQTSNTMFSNNNAYTPAVVAAVGTVDCAGKSKAYFKVKINPPDLSSAISLSVIPFFQGANSPNDWFQGEKQTLSFLGATGQSLCQNFYVDVDGDICVVLVDVIGGPTDTAVTIYPELA